jgi:hypothetical protein
MAVIRAELRGKDQALALGIVVVSSSPVLGLCRKLMAAGYDAQTPLEVYRGVTLCLSVRSIGEAAALEVNGEGNGFRRSRESDAAPPIRQKQSEVSRTPRQA